MAFGIPHFKKPQWVWTDIDIPGLRILKLAHPKRTEGLAPDKAGFCRDGIPAPCTSCRHWNHRQKQSSKPTRSTRHSIISHHISSYRNISHHISSHLIISPHIASYLIISQHILTSHHVLISPHISAYRIISPHVSSYIPISPHISSYILISSYLIIPHHISSYLIKSHHIAAYLITSHHTSSYRIISHHISSYLLIFHHISSYILISPHISSYLSISLICHDFWGSHTRGQNSSADNFFGPRSTSLWQLILKQMTQVISKRLWSNTRHHFSSGIRVISMSHTRLRSMLQKKCGEGRSHWSH
jgi:hypothetical protein